MALKWRYSEHCWGETAEFSVCGLHVHVQDCDGDFSTWDIRSGQKVLAKGEDIGPDHFDVAQEQAEAALRSIIADRLAELRNARIAA